MADFARRRPASDALGLRRVLGDRLLPVLVATMAFLAALALGGAIAAQALADHWRLGAGSALTAQIPQPDPARLERGLSVLRASPAIASARVLSAADRDALLTPWLGGLAGLDESVLPAVIAARAATDPPGGEAAFGQLDQALRASVPGASLERHAQWVGRLSLLLGAMEGCGWGILLLVGTACALVVIVATRAGLVARRATVDILHGLGATDSFVAGGFARRAMALAALGGLLGAACSVPVLVSLARLAEPFSRDGQTAGDPSDLPASLWVGLALIPPAAAAIGYVTAQSTVRLWLRRLP